MPTWRAAALRFHAPTRRATPASFGATVPVHPDYRGGMDEVKAIIAETGAAGMKDLGKVMPSAMKAMGGVDDGKLISEAVKKLLA